MINEESGEKILRNSELDTELSLIIEKNMIPSKIAEKLINKLKEKNVNLTKNQLYSLIEKIQNAINMYKGEQPSQNLNNVTDNKDMNSLVEAIDRLNDRITNIEQNQFRYDKGPRGRISTIKDIESMKTSEFYPNEGGFQPLYEIPNDPESIVILMKWLQYLVDKVGKTHLPDVLDYYVDINWLSDDIREDILEYSKGITEEKKDTMEKTSSDLPTRDHIQSLLYIQKLKGINIDERFISKIDREMSKMTKNLDTYHFK